MVAEFQLSSTRTASLNKLQRSFCEGVNEKGIVVDDNWSDLPFVRHAAKDLGSLQVWEGCCWSKFELRLHKRFAADGHACIRQGY